MSASEWRKNDLLLICGMNGFNFDIQNWYNHLDIGRYVAKVKHRYSLTAVVKTSGDIFHFE